MKSNEEYLILFKEKYRELEMKNELWRLRVTLEEFKEGLEKARQYGIEARKSSYLNEFHIKSNEEGMVGIMLMNKITKEEFKEQAKQLKEIAGIQFALHAPLAKKAAK